MIDKPTIGAMEGGKDRKIPIQRGCIGQPVAKGAVKKAQQSP